MKKILFRTGYLGLGAIEQLAFEIITGLNEKYEMILAIDNEYNNHLVKKLPKNIKVFYLKEIKFLKFMWKVREKKKNPLYRFIYNFLLSFEKLICEKKINNWLGKNGGADLFIDYDGMALKYAHKVNIEKKIVWQHTALSNEKHLGRMEKRLKNYDKIALICEDMKSDYEEKFPSLKNKFVTQYNFLDIERIQRMMTDESELTQEEKGLQKEKYCVTVARLDEPKDFYTLIKAFKILKTQGIEEKLYIIGEGELRKKIEDEIKKNNLENVVILLGRKYNPYTWMKNADIFIHSSKREGMPMVLLEAIACGKMIISSDCPTGPREILENGESGELYQVGDFEKLAFLLKKYLESPQEKERYIKKAEKRLERFKKQRVIEEYKKFFDEIIGER